MLCYVILCQIYLLAVKSTHEPFPELLPMIITNVVMIPGPIDAMDAHHDAPRIFEYASSTSFAISNNVTIMI